MTEGHEHYPLEKKLHPLTLFYRLIKSLPGIAFPVLAAFQFGGFENWTFIIIIIVAGFLSVPFSLLHYFNYFYSITDRDFIIRSGVFQKNIRTIPLSKIQNITYEQTFLQKLLKITKLQIETAGDAKTEGMLEFISLTEAEEIKKSIRDFRLQKEDPQESSETAKPKNARVLFRLNLKEAFIFGMMRFRPMIFLFLVWAFSIFSQFSATPFFRSFRSDIDDLETRVTNIFTGESILYIITVVILSFIIAFIIGWIADILLTVNKFYNFTLTEENRKLFTSQGLFSRRKTTLPLGKLQMMTLVTNPIRKKFGYYGLEIQTAGFGSDKVRNAESVIPFSKFEKIRDLSHKLVTFELPEKFRPISRKAIRKAFFRYCIFLIILIIPFLFLSNSLFWLFLMLPLLYIPALVRYQYRGYHMEEDKLIVRQGFWNNKTIIVPLSKIQTLNKVSSFFQRRLGLSSLFIDTAAGNTFSDCKIADISSEDADIIMEEIKKGFKANVKHKKFAID